MITITTCMIVKNESKFLARCLDCIKQFSDEIVIIDTGSTDNTIEIASQYTNCIYSFDWIDDFAAARNYSFSKATKDYIYIADADEVIDITNIQKIQQLKQVLLPEIEIVEMYYANQLQFSTTYNYDKEYRPKLVKRLRSFTWIEPIHEHLLLDPIIYESDIEILHCPDTLHAPRDFSVFQKELASNQVLSPRLTNLYARELFIAGSDDDFLAAKAYFQQLSTQVLAESELKTVQCVLAKCALIEHDMLQLMTQALKNMATGDGSAEICYVVGEFYQQCQQYQEAILWFYNAAKEATTELNIHYGGDYPLQKLAECYLLIGDTTHASEYQRLYENWSIQK